MSKTVFYKKLEIQVNRIVVMKKRYIRGLMVIMFLGIVSELYSSLYERYVSPYLPSRETMHRYAPYVGALGGVVFGAGYLNLLDRRNPIIETTSRMGVMLLAGAAGVAVGMDLREYYQRQEWQEHNNRLMNEVDYATQLIRELGIRRLPRQDILISLKIEGLVAPIGVTDLIVRNYVTAFLNEEITQEQIVNFNRAIIDCLKDAACCSLNRNGKRFFLRRFFHIYADPEKAVENNAMITSFYAPVGEQFQHPNREPLSDDKINEVIDYLDEHNRFNSHDLFKYGQAIKGADE